MNLGRYVLGERLAVGGMGEVYVGLQRGLGDFEKPLAIKLLLPHLAQEPSAVAEFLNEARVASRLAHPNVVQVLDVGQEGTRYFLAMELVRGVSASSLRNQLLAAKELLSPALVTYVAHALLDGLQHAHELTDRQGAHVGLVHRDVSPHNVLLSVSGEVKLADFGIARAQDTQGSTRSGMVKGKPAYLAPELFDGKPASQLTDVFAAAVTIFELATLQQPFKRDTDAATMKAIYHDPLPSLRVLRPDLPEALEAALVAATTKDPSARTPSARALREAIPTLHDPTVAKELGALVVRLEGPRLQSIDQRTKGLRTAASRHTRQATGDASAEPATRASRPVRLMAAGAGGAVLLLLLGIFVARVLLPPPPPAPVTRTVVEQPPEAPPRPAPSPVHEPEKAPEKEPVKAPVKEPMASTPRVQAPARKIEPAGPKIGYLSVDAKPWASVSVRGKVIGDTPLYKFPLDEGRVVIELKNADTGRSATRKVSIVRGKETSLKVNLE